MKERNAFVNTMGREREINSDFRLDSLSQAFMVKSSARITYPRQYLQTKPLDSLDLDRGVSVSKRSQ